MNFKKPLLLILPTLFPYGALGALLILLRAPRIMELVFKNNPILLLAAVFLMILVSMILTAITCVISIRQRWDPVFLAKTTMIIKLIQIPAYVAIFLMSLISLITIFLLPFVPYFFIMDCLAILMTGLLGTAAAIREAEESKSPASRAVLPAVLQFIFCVDVVVSVVYYIKMKKRRQTAE